MLFTIMEKWYNVGIALLLCIVTSSTRNENNGWCSPYYTFCLFSEGTETSVSNLSEAQFKCSEIKNDSWPVELGDERIKEVFIEFIHNYSISNVILNADNQNDKWYWIKSNTRSMARNYILAAVLFYVQTSSEAKGHYGWCSPYDTFCLFSEGIEARVSSLSEAQLKCSEIKNDSWPVELGDERIKKVFIEFIHNYSISNVILNADNRNGAWYWIKSNTSFQCVFNVKDKIISYNKSEIYFNYSVVCMTDCWANWTDINETQLIQPDAYYHHGIKTPEECKEYCEKITCSSIGWTYAYPFHGCWIHKYPYDASKLNPSTTSSHHVIDRTVKSVGRCIGEVFLYSSVPKPVQSSYESTNLVEILIPIISVICLIVIIAVLIVYCKRQSKARQYVDRSKERTGIDNAASSTNEEPADPAPAEHYETLNSGTSDINVYTHLSHPITS